MLVIALCTVCFFRAKINKKTLAPYFEYSGAGTGFQLPVECALFYNNMTWKTDLTQLHNEKCNFVILKMVHRPISEEKFYKNDKRKVLYLTIII